MFSLVVWEGRKFSYSSRSQGIFASLLFARTTGLVEIAARLGMTYSPDFRVVMLTDNFLFWARHRRCAWCAGKEQFSIIAVRL